MVEANKMVAMEEAAMTPEEKEDALEKLAAYLLESPDAEINTEAFCNACDALALDAFAFLEEDLKALEEKINQSLKEAAEAASDWVDINEESLNRLAMYLVSFTDGHIDTEVFYTACLACKMDPHAMTDAHMNLLQEKINDFDKEINGDRAGTSTNGLEATFDQIAQYLATTMEGHLSEGIFMDACYQFGVDPYALSAQEMARLEEKINSIGCAPQVDDAALNRLAHYIVENAFEDINTEVLYQACHACGVDPYALDDQSLMLLQGKLNALAGEA